MIMSVFISNVLNFDFNFNFNFDSDSDFDFDFDFDLDCINNLNNIDYIVYYKFNKSIVYDKKFITKFLTNFSSLNNTNIYDNIYDNIYNNNVIYNFILILYLFFILLFKLLFCLSFTILGLTIVSNSYCNMKQKFLKYYENDPDYYDYDTFLFEYLDEFYDLQKNNITENDLKKIKNKFIQLKTKFGEIILNYDYKNEGFNYYTKKSNTLSFEYSNGLSDPQAFTY